MDFEIGISEELPFLRNNFVSDKSLFLVDFLTGRTSRPEGFNTIGNKQKKKNYRRNYNRRGDRNVKKKNDSAVSMSRSQRKERIRAVHKNQRSKAAKLRAAVWTSYRLGTHMSHNRHLKLSIEVKSDWKTNHQFDYSELQKQKIYLDHIDHTVLATCGFLPKFNNAFQRITPTSPSAIKRDYLKKRIFFHPRAVKDPVLVKYAKEKMGNVFATGKVLGMLMSCTRAVHSFHIKVMKRNGIIFLDHEPKNTRVLEITTNETSRNAPPVCEDPEDVKKNMNCSENLRKERTRLNKCFGEQVCMNYYDESGKVVSKNVIKLEKDSPFKAKNSKVKLANKGYIYKKISLSPDVEIVCRNEVDCVVGDEVKVTTEIKREISLKSYAINRCVHEYEQSDDEWVKKLEEAPGSVIMNQVLNNSFEFSRWIFECLMCNANYLNLGFAKRKVYNSDRDHELLKVEQYDTWSLANQFHVDLKNGYGILEEMFSTLLRLEDGDYYLVKIPNKQCVNCYRPSKEE